MTNQAKHTPGPWAVSNSGGAVQVGGIRHPQKICVLEKAPLKITPEIEANANLIAAAPDMLKALEGALEEYRKAKELCGIELDAIPIDAAIEKAKGK